ncbi:MULTISPECIES: vWA domain-containing protein [unclassified Fusibacter]|uniref:vWA domain-containing protein n=1 Tax=unclassified Fusibacter TaxID=2624464 RepID=UPI001011BF49|nr:MULTISPECIES: vWA domain-containing protein [unclassified Fusibacter]MCK8060744.1 VWA domain-containing protein [Fusibacter sp. A2]NPE23040.1 VWA domain-containing protein [Fusibacter sp. A1]RXV59712.1 VWA domain-containing protein [Fusibacter sp. A1]
MKKDLTELIFILDRSGSMSGLESDTIGGYNAMLAKQAKVTGEVIITTVLFDDEYELLHDRINLRGVKPITEKEYFVRGSTALLDAVGKSIQKIVNVQSNTSEDEKAEKVLFVITTDGLENASREYSYKKIKAMIEKQKKRYDWEFIFLGANIDAVSEAEKFGIYSNRAAQFHNDKKGIELNYQAVSEAICELRSNRSISEDWKRKIDKDYSKRK